MGSHCFSETPDQACLNEILDTSPVEFPEGKPIQQGWSLASGSERYWAYIKTLNVKQN